MQMRSVVLTSFAALIVVISGSGALSLPGYVVPFNPAGLDMGKVTRMAFDEGGVKWFGLRGPGLIRFDGASWEAFHLSLALAVDGEYRRALAGTVTDLCPDGTGGVWMTTGEFGQRIYHFAGGEFEALEGLSENQACRVFGWGAGSLWVAGQGESGEGCVAKWMGPDSASWMLWYYDYGEVWRTSFGGFAAGREGELWFGAGFALVRIRDAANAPQVESVWAGRAGPIMHLAREPGGRLWVARYAMVDVDLQFDPPHSVLYSDNQGSDWEFLEYPAVGWRKTSIASWIEPVPGQGIWVAFAGLRGGGALWYDYNSCRWLDLGRTEQIEVDAESGDVWFLGSYGQGGRRVVAVMRGGPDAWPPVWIELEARANPSAGTLSLVGSAEFQMDLNLDLYIAVELPDGRLLFAPGWTSGVAPFLAGIAVPIGLALEDFPLLTMDASDLKSGNYRFYAAFTHTGTVDLASNIASCEWEFEE